MSERNKRGRFGLTPDEYENLKGGLRYILTIVFAVTITFLILAVGANLLGV